MPSPWLPEPRIRVVAADDDRSFLESFGALLERTKSVEIVGLAADGHEVVELARGLEPDVVLMDIEMPVCDGIEATRRIAALVPSVSIILVSATADTRTIALGLQAGARAYVNKDGQMVERALAAMRAARTIAGRDVDVVED
jgi:DNA-binding NarL/FixJ family response regulator